MPFRNRKDGGEKLAGALARFVNDDVVVLALPRGGVPVALPVARALGADVDLLIVRKIGVPFEPEVAMGAVLDGIEPVVVRNEDVIRRAGISEQDFDAARKIALAELQRRSEAYRQKRAMPDIAGRIVIVVDDGIATGATMRAALKGLRRLKPGRLVAAAPVVADDALRRLANDADEVIALETLGPLGGIGAHYDDFRQLNDADVIRLLETAGSRGAGRDS